MEDTATRSPRGLYPAPEGLLTEPRSVLEASFGEVLLRPQGCHVPVTGTHTVLLARKAPAASLRRSVKGGLPSPCSQRVLGFGCCLCTPATDGDQGSVRSRSPKPCDKRTADSMSWPETAQAAGSPVGQSRLQTRAEPLTDRLPLPPVCVGGGAAPPHSAGQ